MSRVFFPLAGQEPGTNEEIKAFANARGFGDPPELLMDKVEVNGGAASPVFQFLKVASGDTSFIGWNFAKVGSSLGGGGLIGCFS